MTGSLVAATTSGDRIAWPLRWIANPVGSFSREFESPSPRHFTFFFSQRKSQTRRHQLLTYGVLLQQEHASVSFFSSKSMES